MASTAPAIATAFAYQGCRPMNPDTNPPRSAPRAPTPTPSAAMIPTILPTSTGPLGFGMRPVSRAAFVRAS